MASSPARVPSPTVRLRPDSPALAAFVRVLANLTDAMSATWAGAVDGTDPEMLHQLRVAIRRSRSVVTEGKGVLPGKRRAWARDELRWLGAVTSPTRDLDVYAIEWDDYVSPFTAAQRRALEPVREHLAIKRGAVHATMSAALQSSRAEDVMSRWRQWLAKPTEPTGGAAGAPIITVASARIKAAQRGVLDQGRAITPDSPAEDLHELRKTAKKLRYLLECFGDLYAKTARAAFVKELKALQDNLGQHQDAEVHVDQLAAVRAELESGGASEDTLIAIDLLCRHLDEVRRRARTDFAERFAAYDTKPNRTALRALLNGDID